MKFAVDDEAAALRDAGVAVLAGEATPALVRAGWPGGDLDAVRAVWRKLAGAGVLGVLVAGLDSGPGGADRDLGGLGLSEQEGPLYGGPGCCRGLTHLARLGADLCGLDAEKAEPFAEIA